MAGTACDVTVSTREESFPTATVTAASKLSLPTPAAMPAVTTVSAPNPSSTSPRSQDVRSQIPGCPADISQPLFDTLPMALDEFFAFRPLGWLSLPIHLFPAKHSSFAMALPGQAPPKKPVNAPGKVWVTEIWKASCDTGSGNYQVYFYPCREFRAYFYHLSSIADKLRQEFDKGEARCSSFPDGTATVTTCRREQLLIQLDSGEQLGIGTDSAGVDFGATDNRLAPARFANIAHYSYDYPYYVSPVDYFSPALRAKFETKLGSVFGAKLRSAEPRVGAYMQDIVGTAQGNWFFPGISYRDSTDISSALALVHDYLDPTQPIFSAGNSIKGLKMGLYSFSPQNDGVTNQDFAKVKAQGAVYCYDRFLSGTSAGGVGLGNPHGVILLTMPADSTLKIEKVGGDGSTCQSSTPWTFSPDATTFER
ncbi:MAG: hypothetical protein Q7O66_15370 [Dehalococcoidia bacterium]|nr:hypothetical protein [Dehalococcoidia bacterium]